MGGIGSACLTRHRRPPSRVHRCADEEDFGRRRRLPEGAREELMLVGLSWTPRIRQSESGSGSHFSEVNLKVDKLIKIIQRMW